MAAEAQAAATAAAAVVPETAAGYALNIPESLKGALNAEALANDPAIVALRDHYKAQGRPQGDFDKLFEAMGVLQDKGILGKPVDFAAETAALGANGVARQKEVETFAQSLKQRGEITDAEFGDLMSLAPTASGVSLVEKMRSWKPVTDLKNPGDTPAVDPKEKAQADARTLAEDPKYGKDRAFTQAADEAYKKAFS